MSKHERKRFKKQTAAMAAAAAETAAATPMGSDDSGTMHQTGWTADASAVPGASAASEARVAVETTVADVAELLATADEVLCVPGEGMVEAEAHDAVGELVELLIRRGVRARIAIHPAAGHEPGRVRRLLAQAGCPRAVFTEAADVAADFEGKRVILAVGANDVLNPSVRCQGETSGEDVAAFDVRRATSVVFCKRSLRVGKRNLQNAAFFSSNASLLLGDARETVMSVIARINAFRPRLLTEAMCGRLGPNARRYYFLLKARREALFDASMDADEHCAYVRIHGGDLREAGQLAAIADGKLQRVDAKLDEFIADVRRRSGVG